MQIKRMFKNYWPLILILVVAGILRLWRLGNIPPSLTQDEAALGYNAYSILKTGRDEYGKILPIVFKSFGDYKPGLYVYLDVPFVAVFGLNEVATRLPSAMSGILIVYFIYLISSTLFDRKIGILSAFVAAITPWLIYFSRGAWEANVSLALTLGGIYFFLKSLQSNKLFIISALLLSLTTLTYQGAKLSTAIVVLILTVIYFKDILRFQKKCLFSGIAFGIIISAPIILSLFNGQSGRLDVFSIFSYPRPKDYTQAFLDEGKEKIGDLNYYLFHSELLNFKRGILGRYFNHFSAKFLFFEGDYQNPQHSAPYQGMLLVSDLVLIIVGFVAIIRKNVNKEIIFVLTWLALSPLPAILSRDQVQSVRALNMAVPIVIILSFGLYEITVWLNKRFGKYWTYLVVVAFYLIPFIYFLDAYYIHVPAHNSQYWNYGYKEVVKTVSVFQENFKTIKVQQSFNQPYIYFLFYQKYDPSKYQKQAKLLAGSNAADVGMVAKLDNIEFTQVNWDSDKFDKNSLLVAGPISLPENVGLIKEIKYLNGRDVAFKIIQTK